MNRIRPHAIFVSIALLCVARSALAQGDPEVIQAIIDEGKSRSQVWELLEHLSENIGVRLTGSTSLEHANAWTRDAFRSWGLHNAHLHKWGEVPVRFDRGPSRARMIKPVEREFEFTTRAWAAGTNGPVVGRVVKEPATMEQLEAMRDQLRGAWVLGKTRPRTGRRGVLSETAQPTQADEIQAALYEAGIAGRILGATGELVVTTSERGWRELEYHNLPTEVTVFVRRSDYDAINSRLADGEEVEVEIDLQHSFVEGPIPQYNTIAEIPGTEFPEQVVIISAHLDTWDGPGSQGAQDNGVGSAVTLEAARILATVGIKPRRTIRFCLWGGEEQGLLGSRGYLESLSEEERANISAVFVDDGGTNYQGGLQCIEAMAEMLTRATAPVNEAFPDMPVKINVRERMPRGGGSDHATFNRVGIPGFFWDEVGIGGREGKNYRFIHHTQNDTLRYVVPEYLVQSATCSAITAYNLAMADTLLPREVPSAEQEERTPPRRDPVADAAGDFAPIDGPLNGRWVATIVGDSPYAGSQFTLTLQMGANGQVQGTNDSRIGSGPLHNVSYDAEAGQITFTWESDMVGTLYYRATIKGDEMTGALGSDQEYRTQFKAVRQLDAVATEAGAGAASGE